MPRAGEAGSHLSKRTAAEEIIRGLRASEHKNKRMSRRCSVRAHGSRPMSTICFQSNHRIHWSKRWRMASSNPTLISRICYFVLHYKDIMKYPSTQVISSLWLMRMLWLLAKSLLQCRVCYTFSRCLNEFIRAASSFLWVIDRSPLPFIQPLSSSPPPLLQKSSRVGQQNLKIPALCLLLPRLFL